MTSSPKTMFTKTVDAARKTVDAITKPTPTFMFSLGFVTIFIALVNVAYFYFYFMMSKKVVVLDKGLNEYGSTDNIKDTIDDAKNFVIDSINIKPLKIFDAIIYNTLPFIFNFIIIAIYFYLYLTARCR